MKINYYIALTLFLGACTAPTTSINLETTTPSTDGFLFYVDEYSYSGRTSGNRSYYWD